jgi:DNA-binding transcriptional MerR regulator
MSVIIKKLYYSISEVCEMTQLKQYVLRYWENEFDLLKPSKNRSGNRIYTKEDIDNILLIKKLLYEEKYTIDGAKKVLAEEGSLVEARSDMDIQEIIQDIRSEIKDIIKELE